MPRSILSQREQWPDRYADNNVIDSPVETDEVNNPAATQNDNDFADPNNAPAPPHKPNIADLSSQVQQGKGMTPKVPGESKFPGGSGSSSAPLGTPAGGMSTPGGVGGPGAPVAYSPNGGVEQWSPQIEEALRRNGLPTTPDYIQKVKTQVQSESSGNPKAINNSDSNAAAGHPSQGLLQTIPGTFQQHHLPGDSNDITDPQANLDSAIGYAKSRYGPTLMDQNGNGIGSGHGY